MNQSQLSWWNLSLTDRHQNSLNDAFNSKKLSYNTVGSQLEKKLAGTLKVKHCLMTTSGSTALLIALKSLGVGPGDEVIIPNRTFQATANAVCFTGARVKIADVCPDTALIDPAGLEKLISSRTKAIIPVHLNGRGCNMKKILEIAHQNNLFVVEDSAQAFMSSTQGLPLGSFGNFGCFSLGVTKFITSGQGGFIVTNSDELYSEAKKYIFHAATGNDVRHFNNFGFNFRLSDLLSSLALTEMDHLEEKRAKYIKHYLLYRELLQNSRVLSLMPSLIESGEVPIWIEVLSPYREKIAALLKKNNIETVKSYPSVHRSAYLMQDHQAFPHSEKFENEELILPCGPDITESQIRRVVQTISEFEPLA